MRIVLCGMLQKAHEYGLMNWKIARENLLKECNIPQYSSILILVSVKLDYLTTYSYMSKRIALFPKSLPNRDWLLEGAENTSMDYGIRQYNIWHHNISI